jgi:hypothetical protein
MTVIVAVLIVVAFLVRSVWDISGYVGTPAQLEQSDTSDGHFGCMTILFVIGLICLFALVGGGL